MVVAELPSFDEKKQSRPAQLLHSHAVPRTSGLQAM